MRSIRRVCFYLLLIACLGTMACTGKLFRDFGRINLNTETTRIFESGSVNPDFRYYVSGPDIPYVIIGIHRDYSLDTQSLWKEVAMTPEVMKNIVGDMTDLASVRQLTLYGFDLVDPDGKPIGIWYSIEPATTCMQMKKNGTIRIDTPELENYETLDGNTGCMMNG